MSKSKIVFILVFLLTCYPFAAIADSMHFSTTPVHSPSNSGKWNIGYVQGGEYGDYCDTLLATLDGLIKLGWIDPIDTSQFIGLDAGDVWKILAQKANSSFLRFVGDGFYSADWKSENRKEIKQQLEQRIQAGNSLDLLIAMGTWAGQDLSKSKLDIPVIVMCTSNPVAAGIIKSPKASGKKNLHAQFDPTFHERQIKYFHLTVPFKKLGIIFEDTDVGKSYAGFSSVEKAAKENGFDLVVCHAQSDIPDTTQCEKEYLDCVDNLATKIDALYVTAHGGVNAHTIPLIVEKTIRYSIPTFSQYGSKDVEKGLLISLSRTSYKKVGMFEAAIIANVLNGANPGDLVQVFEEPLQITLNIDTAQHIGYLPTADVIAAADKIFHSR
ncbi:ABC transporter substrate binding protein [uncultured Desulfobacter sp.]|uniref:ABC transporter substrate-binding protein n=1 Tax=uncultured Desulfobacter sp. TaxID=240139 RepID=UPI0029F51F90|nr:ABC transporter substrate binding protein [uncultured Desulfobacter sp.]